MPDPKHINKEEDNAVLQNTKESSTTKEKTQSEIQTPKPEVAVEFTKESPKPGEAQENFFEETIGTLKNKLKNSKAKKTIIPQIRDDVTVQIEKIMEQDLNDAFRELTPIQKQEFKIKGEQVAFEIRALLKNTHIKAKNIFKLILEWLRMLPGINKFFLEQEAKIKTDKILALKNRK